MRILAISDVHDEFERFAPDSLPVADLIVVCGDLTNYGRRAETYGRPEVSRAVAWLTALAARAQTLWITGNHDFGMSGRDTEHIPNLHFIEGDQTGQPFIVPDPQTGTPIRFWGVNMSPCFDAPQLAHDWTNMTANPKVDAAAFDFEAVDVVVSHCPPLNCLDNGGYVLGQGYVHLGSPALRDYIIKNKPGLVLCGHIHEAAGRAMLGGTWVVNTARKATLIDFSRSPSLEKKEQ